MKAGGKPKNLKQNNSRAVFELLRHGEKIAVAEIAEKIRLSKTTIKKVFDSLLADSLISMCGKGEFNRRRGQEAGALLPESLLRVRHRHPCDA